MRYFVSFFIIFLCLGCGKEEKKIVEKGDIFFQNVALEASGLDFENKLFYKSDLNIIEYLYYYNGGGVALGDINNDGLEDIYLTANQVPDRLFLNQGNLKFKDITKDAKLSIDSTWSTGVTMADINNDGLLDIYVSKVGNYKSLKGHNLLYINKGENIFEESSKKYGLDFSGFSTQASFFDYDNDGDLDMYLMNHSIHTPRSYGDIKNRNKIDLLAGDKLYENKLNEGLTKFSDVSTEAGIYSSALGYGLALITSDINNDGLIDIYVGNDFHENDYLYINQGDKTFKESNVKYFDHTPRFTMGVDVGDINNDTYFDLIALDMMPFDHEIFLKSGGEDSDKVSQIKKNFGFETQYARNTLQVNNNNQSFTDVALMSDTYATDWSWTSLIEDYDNDGLNDIYITNGIYKRPNDLNYINYLSNVNFAKYDETKQDKLEERLINEMPTLNIPNVIFRNKGNMSFDRFSEESGLSPSYSNGAAYSDLDNDGDIDIVVNNINQPVSLLENISSNTHNYISFLLKTNKSKGNPMGAKILVYQNGNKLIKELTATRGFQSSSSHKLHFGLGQIKEVDSVQIFWLDKTKQTIVKPTLNKEHLIFKDTVIGAFVNYKNQEKVEFTPFQFVHLENNYLDYEREPLMPEKLSTEGPAFVCADFNNDGLEDLLFGSAKYHSPSLYFKQENGNYVKDTRSEFKSDILYEDVDITVFDIENDGDLDLYIMSGGNDKIENSPELEDRIYINDGTGFFSRLQKPLIKTNGGSVSAADYSGDGYSDLFIGNRSIPGGYGLSPYSYILKNNGEGGYSIVWQTRLGMITDSQWVDVNNDQLLDLIIVGDWMPITIMINEGDDKFVNKTKEYGLENSFGMWNVVKVLDIDNNGEKDILAGNTGLNFKWKASSKNPVKLFIDDFDDNKQSDPVIFYDFFGSSIPFSSRDRLANQMPSLKKKFLSYEDFSKVDNIEDLVGKSESEILETKKITELRSMLYLNIGGDSKEIALPKTAQLSSIEDFYIDKDRIYYVGNYYGYTTELGKNKANSGGILNYNSEDGFRSLGALPIPKNLESRRIYKIGKNEFIVVANNNKSYTFKN